MNRQAILKQLRSDIERGRLLDPGDRVVLAVSGGPDSMAMLHLMVELNRVDDMGWALHVAHLNHRIRGQAADADAAFVAEQAKSLGLPCTVECEDIPAAAAEAKRSVEETGRARRYAFLERVCLRTESRVAAAAHQADDNAETVLHHILRGTGLRGLSGMPACRPIRLGSDVKLIRPMLGFRREDLQAYLEDAGVPSRHDRTNESDEQTRNRLRNRLLPMLRDEFNPQVVEALLRLAEQAQWFEEYLEATAARTFETLIVDRTDQELVLNVDALLKKSPIIQTELIRRAIMTLWAESTYRGEWLDREVKELTFGHLRAVVELASDPHSGRKLSLPGDMTVARQYRRLIFSLPSDRPRERVAAEVRVVFPGRTLLPGRRLEILTETVDFKFEDWPGLQKTKPKDQEWLDFDRLRPPLVVRSRRTGERFWPLGAPGSKKLSDYFIDSKVPPEERDRVAILCDQLGPVWVIGHRIDERVRLHPDTRTALKVTVKALGS